MSIHTDQAEAMQQRIGQLRLLRDAQETDGRHWRRYQDQITALTTALISQEGNIAALEELDGEISRARARLAAAERRAAATTAGLPRTAGGLGTAGVGLLLIGLNLAWSPAVVAGIGLILGAAGAVLLLSRRRGADDEAIGAAREALAELEARRAELLPYPIDTILSAALTAPAA